MTTPRKKKQSPAAGAKAQGGPERRQNPTLREIIDDLIDHVRAVSSNAENMSPEELDYAQERLQWFADEIWESAIRSRPWE